jgi:anthranilate synthase component 2
MGNKKRTITIDCYSYVDDDNIVQAIKHETYNVRGVQFHPESVMTPQGKNDN